MVEGANGPTTEEAERILTERGVAVVPDILANALAYHEAGLCVLPTPAGGEERRPERFDVKVVTEGTLEEALHNGAVQVGRTIATPLPPGVPGVRIPRGLDMVTFWKVIEECCQRADEANAKAAAAV